MLGERAGPVNASEMLCNPGRSSCCAEGQYNGGTWNEIGTVVTRGYDTEGPITGYVICVDVAVTTGGYVDVRVEICGVDTMSFSI